MRKLVVVVLPLLVASACGGGSNQNSAAGTQFTYGTPSPASASVASTISGQLASTFTASAPTDPSGALALSDFTNVTAALLGDSGVNAGALASAVTAGSRQALARVSPSLAERLATSAGNGVFDNPACITSNATSFTLTGCKATLSDSSGTVTITANGNASLTAANGTWTLNWSFDVAATATSSSGDTATVEAKRTGNLAVTSTTVNGGDQMDVAASWKVSGTSGSAALSESVALTNITYQTSPTACITGGTLEAKRVWNQIPTGASAASYPNRAALVTWTGCNTATVQFSK